MESFSKAPRITRLDLKLFVYHIYYYLYKCKQGICDAIVEREGSAQAGHTKFQSLCEYGHAGT